jgi:release factor glutamine methyltransferase
MIEVIKTTVRARLKDAGVYLTQRGVDETEANAEFLMAEVLGCGRSQVRACGAQVLTDKQNSQYWELIKHRGRRVPLAYVIGHQPFAGCDIKVTPSVLIPRPETEQLVEAVVALAKESGAIHILDIGTGSGCLPVAIAKALPQATLYATEIDTAAIRIAEENASRNGVSRRIRFLREDLFKPAKRSAPWADIVVTNPPYIPSAEVACLDKEVLREPKLALDGGRDGLDAIRAIVSDAPRMLKPGGSMCMEFGDGQEDKVSRIFLHNGFSSVDILSDLQGRRRIAVARLPAVK